MIFFTFIKYFSNHFIINDRGIDTRKQGQSSLKHPLFPQKQRNQPQVQPQSLCLHQVRASKEGYWGSQHRHPKMQEGVIALSWGYRSSHYHSKIIAEFLKTGRKREMWRQVQGKVLAFERKIEQRGNHKVDQRTEGGDHSIGLQSSWREGKEQIGPITPECKLEEGQTRERRSEWEVQKNSA